MNTNIKKQNGLRITKLLKNKLTLLNTFYPHAPWLHCRVSRVSVLPLFSLSGPEAGALGQADCLKHYA